MVPRNPKNSLWRQSSCYQKILSDLHIQLDWEEPWRRLVVLREISYLQNHLHKYFLLKIGLWPHFLPSHNEGDYFSIVEKTLYCFSILLSNKLKKYSQKTVRPRAATGCRVSRYLVMRRVSSGDARPRLVKKRR